jgi:hypothetical protein
MRRSMFPDQERFWTRLDEGGGQERIPSQRTIRQSLFDLNRCTSQRESAL